MVAILVDYNLKIVCYQYSKLLKSNISIQYGNKWCAIFSTNFLRDSTNFAMPREVG